MRQKAEMLTPETFASLLLRRHETEPFAFRQDDDGNCIINRDLVVVLKHPTGTSKASSCKTCSAFVTCPLLPSHYASSLRERSHPGVRENDAGVSWDKLPALQVELRVFDSDTAFDERLAVPCLSAPSLSAAPGHRYALQQSHQTASDDFCSQCGA
jgi:hypothetical protein